MNRKESIIEMLKENESDYFLHYALAIEYLSENNWILAKQSLEKSIQINNQYTPAYYQLGMLLYQMNQKDKAIHILKKGLEILQINNTQQKYIKEFESAIQHIQNDE